MTISLYSIAANAPHSAARALLYTALLEAMEERGETVKHTTGVPVRFFSYADCVTCDHCGAWADVELSEETCIECGAILPDGETETNLVEILESDFVWHLDKGQAFTYERHTVRENGVSQICLTLSPEAY